MNEASRKRLQGLLCEEFDIRPSVAKAWLDHIARHPETPPKPG